VYNFADFKLLHQIETLANPKGLVAISSAAESTVLACLGLHTGQVILESASMHADAFEMVRKASSVQVQYRAVRSMYGIHCFLHANWFISLLSRHG
jgi:hypothetical protein